MLTIPTQSLHGYSVRFSPFTPNKLACVACQQFGISGSGSLLIFEGQLENDQEPPTLLRKNNWLDGLFDVCWSELDINVCLTACGDGSILLWNQNENEPIAIAHDHQKEVYSVDWNHRKAKNLVVTGSWDTTCKVYDANQLKLLSDHVGHLGVVYSSIWSPHLDDTFASTSADGTLSIWDVRADNSRQTVIPAHETEVLTCDWSKYDDYVVFTGSVDCSVRAWDIRNPSNFLQQFLGHNYAVRRVKCSPFDRNVFVTCSYDFTVRVWDCSKQPTFSPLLQTSEHHTEFVYGLDLSTFLPGFVADCSWDQSIKLFRANSLLPSD